MKIGLGLIILVFGIFLTLILVSISGMQRDLGLAANSSAVEILGSNYSEFGGMPQIFAFWWLVPVLVFPALVIYAIYQIYKAKHL